ncbi:PAS domain-containing protein, partial [Caulobacter sp. CCH5-E12]|uniref:PAS domain-containing protein n=1 Tax=Caulobacter sp. CCH5-E12 TaxID=1768770 RepID=UPI0018D22AFF
MGDLAATFAALNRSQMILELSMSGQILAANENFLTTMGYQLDELLGRRHVVFVADDEARTQSYIDFWRRLREGKFFSDTFHRVAKDGSDVWIQGCTSSEVLRQPGCGFSGGL